MPADDRKSIILSCNAGRSGPQTPVENIVEGRINGLLRDKAYFADKLADERLKREDLYRTLKHTEEDFQQRFKELEETNNRLKTEIESAESTKVHAHPFTSKSTFILNSIQGFSNGLDSRT